MYVHFDNQSQGKNTQKHQHYLPIIRLLLAFTPSLTTDFSEKLYYIMMILCNTKTVFITTPILLVRLTLRFLMFSGAREKVHWEQMG